MRGIVLSVVLPCYNEAACLPRLLASYAQAGRGTAFELVLVDNGSTDDTAAVLAEALPRFPFARSVRVVRNQGYGHGILTGLQAAASETLAWSHADLQTDAADVFRAYDLYRAQPDRGRVLVKGVRSGRTVGQRLVSRGMECVALLCLRRRYREINAQPKLFHRELLAHLPSPPLDFNFDIYVLHQACRHGWHVLTVPVLFPPRPHGRSHWAATWRSRTRTMWRSAVFMFKLGTGLWR